MNAVEARDWLETVADCFPDFRIGEPLRVLGRLEDAAGAGIWEGGACSGGLNRLELRYIGAGAGYAGFARAALRCFCPQDPPPFAAPEPGRPWLGLVWDARSGALEELSVYGRARGRAVAAVYRGLPEDPAAKPALLGLQPVALGPGQAARRRLSRDLASFARLSPFGEASLEGDALSLRLEAPLAWPLFVRHDLAAPFQPHASQLSLFLLNRRVSELRFRGAEVWAYFRA